MAEWNAKANDVFLGAAEVESPAERRLFLDQQCGNDAVLRAQVESLLAASKKVDGFLNEPAVQAFSARNGTVEYEPTEERPGTVIAGRYKLLERIGEGGMGEVWVADQLEPIKRRVAIKLIKPGMDSRSVLGRFEAERQALAVMDHPNIAKVLDAGTSEVGRPYFVMELVKGTPITEFCDLRKLTTKERLELFIPVCQAIQHAHMKGIIHRDIKPSNVLVALHDETPVPKVIDFGVAKAIGQQLTEKTIYTGFGALIGTPTYMAPEQATFNQLDVDTRADVYALGVLLYELLVGSPPIESSRLKKAAMDEVLRIVRDEEPPRPSQRLSTSQAKANIAATRQSDPAKLSALMKGDLDWIVMKALEKDRTRRYETANGLAADLRRHLANEPVVARPPSTLYRFQKMVRRNTLAFGAAAAVMTVLLLGAVGSTWQAIRATRAETEQSRLRDQAEANERKALDAQLSEAKERHAAEEQRQRAVSQEFVTRQQAYAADMNLTQQALAMNNLGRAKRLLNRHRPQPGQLDLRGWEWRYLWGQCRSDAVASFPGNTGTVSSVAVAPDGKWVATNSRGRPLPVFDWETKKEITHDPGIASGTYVAFSTQTPLIAFPMSTKDKHSVRLWDVEKQQVLKDLSLGGKSGRLAFSADGKTLVTTTEWPDSKLTLWRVPEGEPIKSYPIGAFRGTGLQVPFAIARDLSVVAFASNDQPGVIQVMDLANGQKRWSTTSGDDWLTALALSHDGKMLASGPFAKDGTIRLWDMASGKQIGRPLDGHRAWVSELVFWPDGKTLASSSADQTVRLWDLSDPANVLPIRALQGHKNEVWSLALMPDNRHLLSGSKDAELLVWDTAALRRERGPIRFTEKLDAWRSAPDSKSIVVLSRQGHLLRMTGDDFQKSEWLIDVGMENHAITSPDCRLAAAGSNTGGVKVWDLQQRTLLRNVPVSTGKVVPLGFVMKTKKLFVYCEDDSSIREWDTVEWRETRTWTTPRATGDWPFPSFEASADEQWLLFVYAGNWNLLLNTATGRETRLQKDWGRPHGLPFSPDGKFLASVYPTGFATLWAWEPDTAKVRIAHTFDRFMLGAHSVAFSPDGKRLAAGGSGHETIRLWDLESKQELLVFDEPGTGPRLFNTAFSPDGNILGSMVDPGFLYLWRAPSWDEIAAAEAKEKAVIKQP